MTNPCNPYNPLKSVIQTKMDIGFTQSREGAKEGAKGTFFSEKSSEFNNPYEWKNCRLHQGSAL